MQKRPSILTICASTSTVADRRRRWREHHIEHERIAREWAERGTYAK